MSKRIEDQSYLISMGKEQSWHIRYWTYDPHKIKWHYSIRNHHSEDYPLFMTNYENKNPELAPTAEEILTHFISELEQVKERCSKMRNPNKTEKR